MTQENDKPKPKALSSFFGGGSFLGMKLETVSRIFSKFHALGLISVQQRHVRILDVPGLRQALIAS